MFQKYVLPPSSGMKRWSKIILHGSTSQKTILNFVPIFFKFLHGQFKDFDMYRHMRLGCDFAILHDILIHKNIECYESKKDGFEINFSKTEELRVNTKSQRSIMLQINP
jgi:hypothetical protein